MGMCRGRGRCARQGVQIQDPVPFNHGPVQSGFHAALIYGLSKQRIDPRLPAWAGGFERGKYLGIDTHVQRGSLLG